MYLILLLDWAHSFHSAEGSQSCLLRFIMTSFHSEMKETNGNYGYFIKGQLFTLWYNFPSVAVKQHIKYLLCKGKQSFHRTADASSNGRRVQKEYSFLLLCTRGLLCMILCTGGCPKATLRQNSRQQELGSQEESYKVPYHFSVFVHSVLPWIKACHTDKTPLTSRVHSCSVRFIYEIWGR